MLTWKCREEPKIEMNRNEQINVTEVSMIKRYQDLNTVTILHFLNRSGKLGSRILGQLFST